MMSDLLCQAIKQRSNVTKTYLILMLLPHFVNSRSMATMFRL